MNEKNQSLVPFGFFTDEAARFINGPFKRGYHQANRSLTETLQKFKRNLTPRKDVLQKHPHIHPGEAPRKTGPVRGHAQRPGN